MDKMYLRGEKFMEQLSAKHFNIRTLANAFNLAITSSVMENSTLIIYNNKELAIDLCRIIQKHRAGKIHYINLHRFLNADALRAYLFSYNQPAFLDLSEAKTLVFENVDLITKEYQQIIRAFYDFNERERKDYKLIFLSRSTLQDEQTRGVYDSALYFRISGQIIDCRLAESNNF